MYPFRLSPLPVGINPDQNTLQARAQVERLLDLLNHREEEGGAGWSEWLVHTKRPEVAEVWNEEYPMAYWSKEFLLPGQSASGGLGGLSADHALQAARIRMPAIFLGLSYTLRNGQFIASGDTNGVKHYWQADYTEPLPHPEIIGMVPQEDLMAEIALGGDRASRIVVHRYPLGSDATKLLFLTAQGPVYPGGPNSNERIMHDVILGIGGYGVIKKLRELGRIKGFSFLHGNEASTAFGPLAALDDLVEQHGTSDRALEDALRILRKGVVLTNHTPERAAFSFFDRGQCDRFLFPNLITGAVKKFTEEFIDKQGGRLNMGDLALYLAGRINGVSQAHAHIVQRNFRAEYGERLGRTIEVQPVTNGVFLEAWSPRALQLLQNYEVLDQYGMPTEGYQARMEAIPDEEIWRVQTEAEERFRQFLGEGRKVDQFGNNVNLPEGAFGVVDARRVAMYKRREMMFRDPHRLKAILERHPNAHIFIAGKAHETAGDAKGVIEHVLGMIDHVDPNFKRIFKERIHFLQDYDRGLAEVMIPGCRVWLNNPQVGHEACGTSGHKNLTQLKLSTKDGLWAEVDPDSFYPVEGETDSPEELESYYQQFEDAITTAESPQTFVAGVKRLWRGNFLEKASAARMLRDYTDLAFPLTAES